MGWYVSAPAVIAGFALFLIVGIAIGRRSVRALRRDAELLAFIEQTGYSLQCIRGINGDDDAWGVTDGTKVVSTTSYDLREAIESAAQGVTANG